jgi:hypothetical protein
VSIAIVTSTQFSGTLKAKFLAGLRSKGWEGDPIANPGGNRQVTILPPYEAAGKYDDGDGDHGKHQELYNAVSGFNADSSVQLIVAAGGLVSAHAAWKKSTKPFIVLIGTTPNFAIGSNSNYRGGVNLDIIAKNTDRNAALCKMPGVTDPKKICLIWNARSKMGKHERSAWATNGWPLDQQVTTNSDAAISAAFTQAKQANAQGIVISGDPYFTSRMNTLVAAANSSGLKICYPFDAYASATPAPAPGSGIYLGPDLPAAYYEIGQMAGTILTGITATGTAQSVGLITANTGAPKSIAKKTTTKKKKTTTKKTSKKTKTKTKTTKTKTTKKTKTRKTKKRKKK